jgi:hypothetical protein
MPVRRLAFLVACVILGTFISVRIYGFESVARAAPVVAAATALLAALLAARAIWWNRHMARLKATLDLIEGSESKEYYQQRYAAFRTFRRADPDLRRQIADPSVRHHDKVRSRSQDFLNHYELVAIACQRGLLDEGFYRAWMGPTFVRDWNEAAILVQAARRANGPGDTGNPDAYTAFERLARAWGGRRLPK